MAELVIRDWKNGRMLSSDRSHIVADMFMNKNLSQHLQEGHRAQAGEILVCIHWDDCEGNSMTALTLTQKHAEQEELFERRLSQCLVNNSSFLRTFLYNTYSDLDSKLLQVKVHPITFSFVNIKNDPFVQNKQRILQHLSDLVSKYASPLPEIHVKSKGLDKPMEPCRCIVHGRRGDEQPHRMSLRRIRECANELQDYDVSEIFAFMQRKTEAQKKYVEKEFSVLQRQSCKIKEVLTLASDYMCGTHNSTMLHGDMSEGQLSRTTFAPDLRWKRDVIRENMMEVSDMTVQGPVSSFPKMKEQTPKGQLSDTDLSEDKAVRGKIDSEDASAKVKLADNINKEEVVSCPEITSNFSGGTQEKYMSKNESMLEAQRSNDRTISKNMPSVQNGGHSDKKKVTPQEQLSHQRITTPLFPKSTVTAKSGGKFMTLDDIKNEQNGARTKTTFGHVLGTKDENPSSKQATHHQGHRTLAEIREEEWKKSKQEEQDEVASLLSKIRLESLRTSDTLATLALGKGIAAPEGNFLEVLRNTSASCDSGFADEMIRAYEATLSKKDEAERFPMTKVGLDTVFCVDISGSITEKHLKRTKSIIERFIRGIEDTAEKYDIEENIGLVMFGGRARILHHLTNDYDRLRDSIETLHVGGSSPLLEAIAVVFACLATERTCHMDGIPVPQRIIFMTDGMISVDKEEEFDVVNPNDMAKQQLVKTLTNSHLSLLLSGRNVWIPIGNADRTFLKSVVKMCNGELVEGEDVRSLARYQRIMKASGSVLALISTETLNSSNIHTVMENAIDGAAPDLLAEERVEVTTNVKKYLREEKESASVADFDNVIQFSFLPPFGTRMRRGPDWKWEEQDTNGPGTVFAHRSDGGWVWIRWDNGHCNVYRYGNGAYDVLISDDKPPVVKDQRIEVGVHVERGPHWLDSYHDHDGGAGNYGVVVRRRGQRIMVKWKANGNLHQYSFGKDGRFEVTVRDPHSCQKLSP